MNSEDLINLKALWTDLFTMVEEGEIGEFFSVSREQVESLRKAIRRVENDIRGGDGNNG